MIPKILAPISVTFGLVVSASAATLTVDLSGTAQYTDIQSAIDAAADGDTVLVRPGEYVITESLNFNRLHKPDDPASPPVKNIIVKSEGGAEVTTIRVSPPEGQTASVVRFVNGETVQSVVEGFKLKGGSASGVHCENGSSPTLTSCTISGNAASSWQASAYGGGMYCHGSSPTLANCIISGNSASARGSVEFPSASAFGGGLYCVNSSPTLTNCTISGNSARANVNPVISKQPMWAYGGGLYCKGSSATLTNCTISGNVASASYWSLGPQAFGGGLYCSSSASSSTLTNCTISRNVARAGSSLVFGQASAFGGGLYCVSPSSLTLTNCTISGNSASASSREGASSRGGGVYCGNLTALVNCILWKNTPTSVSGNLSHCLTDQDPLFVNPTNGDYHLRPGSPAIDRGTLDGAPTTDIEGRPRPFGAGCDIGAYEYSGSDCNGNGVDDRVDLAEGRSRDCNANGYPDECEPDCDQDGVPDACEIAGGAPDCNANGVPDSCEIAGGAPDCNANGIPDECDIASGTSRDDDSDGIPDDCTTSFKRGDANSDNKVNIADAIHTLSNLFAGGPPASCLDGADANDDGKVNIADAIAILSHLLAHTGPLPEPFDECDIDPTIDKLGCIEYLHCQQ